VVPKGRAEVAATRRIDWNGVADLIGRILAAVARQPEVFAAEAQRRGISVEQVTTAAIVEAVRERVEGDKVGASVSRGT